MDKARLTEKFQKYVGNLILDPDRGTRNACKKSKEIESAALEEGLLVVFKKKAQQPSSADRPHIGRITPTIGMPVISLNVHISQDGVAADRPDEWKIDSIEIK